MESQFFLLALLCGVICAVPVTPPAPKSRTTEVRTNEAISMKYLMDLTECFITVPSGEEMPLKQHESCLASIGTTRLNTAQSINGLPVSKVNKLTKGEVKMTFELVKDDDTHIDLSVHKHHITVVQSTEPSQPCSVLNSTIQLSVLARTSSRMHLVSSTVLQQSNTTGWIRFNGLSLPNSTSTGSIELFLVAHNTCNNQMVDLQEIGIISSSSELAAVLVVYSNATDEMTRSLKSTIVQSLSKSLTKRETGSGAPQLMARPSANPKGPCVTPPLKPCQLVPYNFSLQPVIEVLSVNTTLVSSPTYHGNICRGYCRHPLSGLPHNFHSSLQAHLSITDSDLRKPPCGPIAYDSLTMIFRRIEGNMIKLRLITIPEASVSRCGCV